jgi:hypothetical protein
MFGSRRGLSQEKEIVSITLKSQQNLSVILGSLFGNFVSLHDLIFAPFV